MDDLGPLTEVETRMVDALTAGKRFDLAGESPVTTEAIAERDSTRMVRADLLRILLSQRDFRGHAIRRVDIRGVMVSGNLDLRNREISAITVDACRFAGDARFDGATFTGTASFDGVTFIGDAWFHGATFIGDAGFRGVTFAGQRASFHGATFAGDAWFPGAVVTGDASFERAVVTGDATFRGATFTGDAWFQDATVAGAASFHGATFTGRAWFPGATFTGYASFESAVVTGDAMFRGATFTGAAWLDGATFTGAAWLDGATFTGAAWFGGATFTGAAWFGGATFTGAASFGGATFTGAASFGGATFTGAAMFRGATFTGDAWFDGAIASTFVFDSAEFHSRDPGPWAGERVVLDHAMLHVPSRITVVASEVSAVRFQVREGVHLLICSPRIDLSDATFDRRSIIMAPAPGDIAFAFRPARTMSADDSDPRVVARSSAQRDVWALREVLTAEAPVAPVCAVVSLRRANIAELVVSGVTLDECDFAGAHGLDKIRIDETCTFGSTPRFWDPAAEPFTRRRVIVEEVRWRRRFHHWDSHDPSPGETGTPLPALEVAGIYRQLRKGLEDTKNEPGAADFYYGEMEMRRLAGRERHRIGTPRGFTSRSERALLYAYWAVSGYGLRASRAVVALLLVLAVSAWLFTHAAFATVTRSPVQISVTGMVVPTTPSEPKTALFWQALEFSARESISLLQTRASAILTTTGPGTVLDITLRLLGPLLIALAILAIRGRTKR